ncbi:DUF4019 domain-containing protein [Pseudoxanthomonas sp. Root630]|uniref:DUF4019 domain-containing protein n=1 Tax=Pseudoxanthomonas sp. Root630 TaxID=1736574 RepID=UPI00070317E0|nr:DUF4019 domain-containing protein [Pseudoxanthomonas sp. Root630]KRA45113.1 hypothetical protein ASD72_07545 [Pseudoxanthomonas sp. Root630]
MASVDLLRGGLLVMLLAISPLPSAWAQAASATPSTTAPMLSPDAAVDGALQVAALVDAGRAGELWDGASPVVKRVVARAVFIDGLAASRKPKGAVAGREWRVVRRQRHDGTQGVPAGHYVSVELLARLASGEQMRELVSLRLDEDGVARFSGYVVE